MSPEDTAEFRHWLREYYMAAFDEGSKLSPGELTRIERARSDKAYLEVMRLYNELVEENRELRAQLEQRGDPR